MLKLNQLMQRMPEGMDCGLVTSHVNRRYFTGFPSSAGVLVVMRDKAYLLIDFRYYERACAKVDCAEVILLEDASRQLEELFTKHNCKVIGVESDRMTLDEYTGYETRFPNRTFRSDKAWSELIDSLRMIKTHDEIYKILSAQAITELAFDHILNFIKEGVTEKQVARELERFMLDRADGLAFNSIVVSGRNSSSPHGTPTDKPLEDGDFVTMDFGAELDGYHSDMTRTVCVGEPSDEQVMLYKTVLFGQNMAIDYLKAGQKGQQADKLVREYFGSLNLADAFGHGLGHGVGLEIHEKPTLSPKSQITLEEGMIVTVEPGLYLPGQYGVRIEDMVAITEQGCNDLTKSPKELIRL